MRYLEPDEMWLLPSPTGEDIEVLVAGNRSAPDPARVAVLGRTLPMISTLRVQAEEYLDYFLDRAKFSTADQWKLEGVEFGRDQASTADQFSMFFSIEGDLYGEWSVRIQLSNELFFPISFQRRQI